MNAARGRAVGVWGAGREGLAAVHALDGVARTLLLADDAASERPAELPGSVAFVSGPAAQAALLDAELVVASPGIPRTNPFRQRLEAAGVPVTTGSELWMAEHAATTIGVTGTKGKSTTATMITGFLRAAGVDARLAGNIGIPLLAAGPAAAVTVAEQSSYQCAYLEHSPRLAVVTNLAEDHLPWHGGREQYWADKANLFRHGAEALVTTPSVLAQLAEAGIGIPEGVAVVAVDDADRLPPPHRGAHPHNLANWRLAARAAERWLGRPLTAAELEAAAASFTPLPHRLELVSRARGLHWIDDTLATTPQAAAAALAATPGPVVLIVGGDDRGIDYAPLTAALAEHAARLRVIAIPASGPRMVADFRASGAAPVHDAASLEDAVRLAAEIAEPGGSVLLSPAAPSHNAYANYEAKSAAFRAAAEAL